MITITSEHPTYEYNFDIKFQANIYPSEQSIEKPEEELFPLTKSDRDKIQSGLEKNISEMKTMNEHIEAMIAKLHDKSDKKNRKTSSFHISTNHRDFIITE